MEAIIQQSSQDWWNDHDLEDAHLGGLRDYAQDQAWLQVLRPALNKVADVPGFDREQVDIEDPIYTDNATTLMLHPSSSGPSGPDAVILSATDEHLEIRESGHNPETLTSAEAAERLGVSRESFEQAVDHIETPLQNMSTAYQGIVDRIDQRARDEAHTDSVHQHVPTRSMPSVPLGEAVAENEDEPIKKSSTYSAKNQAQHDQKCVEKRAQS